MLRSLPAGLVDCVVTSPAYWGLRDYGTAPQVWDGDPGCAHEWTKEIRPIGQGGQIDYSSSGLRNDGRTEVQRLATLANSKPRGDTPQNAGAFCRLCGAWRGSLGLEPTLDLYISHLVEIFHEVRRVLKDEGTLWLNMGDGYANDNKWGGVSGNLNDTSRRGGFPRRRTYTGLKPKDLIGQPWRLAFALQADGWWLRSDVIEEVELYCPCGCGYVLEERIWRWSQDRDLIWSKSNPMPESVKGTGYYRHKIRQTTNGKKEWVECPGCEKCNPHGGYVLRWNAGRPTKSHEYIFLLSKSAKYYYDTEAIKESGSPNTHRRAGKNAQPSTNFKMESAGRGNRNNPSFQAAMLDRPVGTSRNKRTVWTVATQPFSAAHFATFPEKLIEPCIRAGTSEKGYCAECGKPWVRMIETTYRNDTTKDGRPAKGNNIKGGNDQGAKTFASGVRTRRIDSTLGWQPSCSCGADIIPGLVLDPFGGAGTVALEAKKLNRDFLIIELKPEYCDMSRKRLAERMPLFVGGEVGKG